ncbi:sulfhydryl oxidase 2 [Poecilia latipinna]|uniref:sulfhydryl oxidase 2 n=1 Tax=Poecilia latipinna TaxID=48699 RepID=UPI00072E5E4A|nr:PREDICTED: sulfhydryl oxidase 2 [Poecilia latipinna]
MFRLWLQAAGLLWLCGGSVGGSGRLYSEEDPLVILGSSSLKPTVTNSSSAWLVQFYSSWCGHCIQYSSTWKALAQDVKDWHEAIAVAVLDCAQEENFEVCKEFSSAVLCGSQLSGGQRDDLQSGSSHTPVKEGIAMETTLLLKSGADREVRSVRQLMVNILQNHSRTERPQSCPPLEPYSAAQLLPLLGQRSDHYTAIIVEEAGSFVGREVILDLLQFSGVEVRRALASDLPLLDVLNMAAFPSVYLLHPNGSHAPLHSEKPLRFFFSSLLRSLPGVQRRSSSEVAQMGALQDGGTSGPWRDFDRSQVYTADLESALHYLLRVELAAHGTLEGAELKVFKDFVTLVAKLYPVGGSVVKLMETLSDWLLGLPLQQIPYQAVLDLVDNKMKISGVFLGAELRWVGCQGSRLGLRGYPCSLWTLFHVLTVQHDAAPAALDGSGLEGEAAPVLQVMRRYIRTFFGCKECGRHFEQAAAASMDQVTSREDEVLWLWNQHNRVNTRLAGSLSDDPVSPKAPWPSPALCPACHEESNGVHVWNHANVLAFLRRHYGASNLNPRYSLTSPRLHAGAGPAQTRRPQEERPAAGGERRKGEDQVELRPIQPGPRRGEQAVLIQGEGGFWILGLGFTSVDMSLCVVLYGSSCLFLMLLFFFFKVRSRRCKLRHARLHV